MDGVVGGALDVGAPGKREVLRVEVERGEEGKDVVGDGLGRDGRVREIERRERGVGSGRRGGDQRV